MRVLHVHKDFEPHSGGGGTARHILGLSRALVDLGATVRVVAPAPEPFTRPFATFAATPAELGAQIDWADVVHVHAGRSSYALAGALAAWRRGKPWLYTPHAYYELKGAANRWAKKVWDRTAEAFIAGRSSGYILLTPAWLDWCRANGVPTDKAVIIPNCVLAADIPTPLRRGSVPHLPGAPAILTVGRLDPVKRVVDTVAALAKPALAAAHLHVVGRGDDAAAIEAQAAALGVADRVTLHGFVDDAGVARMIAGADVFVLASAMEGLPTVLLEMLLARLPIAVSRIPGNLAIADAAGVTTSFEVGDIPGLAAAALAAAGAPVPDSAAAAVRATFTWEARAPELVDLYSRAIPERRAAA